MVATVDLIPTFALRGLTSLSSVEVDLALEEELSE